MDLVYSPRETRWLAAARARGLLAIDGLGMLAHQGARALSHWFGMGVEASALRQFLDGAEAGG
jgi:shikimate dehydrogenase